MFLRTKEERNRKDRERYKNNPIHREKRKESSNKAKKNSYRKNKLIVFKFYSKSEVLSCMCCGLTNYDCLSFDHIIPARNNKNRCKKSLVQVYREIIKNNFPPGFQILCMSCNEGKHNNKTCPHKWTKDEIDKKLNNSHYKYSRIPTLKKFSKNGIIECVNCRETNIFLLAVDHINGGGTKHKKSFKHASEYRKDLRDGVLKEDCQILCHNCNHLKRIEKLNLN